MIEVTVKYKEEMAALKKILLIVTVFVSSFSIGQTAEDYLKKGNEKIRARAYTEAVEFYSKAISLKSDFKQAYKNRGISYSLSGDHEKAIADYDKAISLSAKDYSLYSYRGMAKFEFANGNEGKLKEALPDLEKAMELKPDFIEGHLNLSKVHTSLKNHELAISEATKAISKDKEYGKAYYDRGIAYKNNDELIMACIDWKRAKGKGFAMADQALTSFCE